MKEEAIFAAGCFWGVQSAFDKLDGIMETEVGYTGGHTQNPTYESVCSDRSGHAEAVRVIFDPQIISYDALVRKFFDIHDSTIPNRQGPDIGSQYRSAIFYKDENQKKIAEKIIAELNEGGRFSSKIITEVSKASVFYPAEDYHQKYFEKRGGGMYHI